MLRLLTAVLFVSILAVGLTADVDARGRGNPNPAPVVYVTSQGLHYDSIVTADPLPWRGRFQKLEIGPGGRIQTLWGPGDHGYVGGRWWMDTNGNHVQDASDHYFLCPLLGPGRQAP
ncbi:MAG: hypothetical protein ACK2T6_03175 [Anaerolineae bacterium]